MHRSMMVPTNLIRNPTLMRPKYGLKYFETICFIFYPLPRCRISACSPKTKHKRRISPLAFRHASSKEAAAPIFHLPFPLPLRPLTRNVPVGKVHILYISPIKPGLHGQIDNLGIPRHAL